MPKHTGPYCFLVPLHQRLKSGIELMGTLVRNMAQHHSLQIFQFCILQCLLKPLKLVIRITQLRQQVIVVEIATFGIQADDPGPQLVHILVIKIVTEVASVLVQRHKLFQLIEDLFGWPDRLEVFLRVWEPIVVAQRHESVLNFIGKNLGDFIDYGLQSVGNFGLRNPRVIMGCTVPSPEEVGVFVLGQGVDLV
jgi:hypothetical protein